MANKIRNIIQTHQEREVIKTAPDVVVHLDNYPYLRNWYVNDGDKPYTLVSFNDHLISFQASYDVDTLVPTASITLSIPNHEKHLYMAPGGNNVIESMMYVKVFAKGYFPSASGKTVYHRVFRGVTTSITHVDNGTTLDITIQCSGVLHFFDFMYVDLNPSLMTNSEHMSTPMQTRYFHLGPYDMLATTFAEAVSFEGFQLNALTQQKIYNGGDDFKDAIKAGYINKWNEILLSVVKDTRIFGNTLNSGKKLKLENGEEANIYPIPLNKDESSTALEVWKSADPAYKAVMGDRYRRVSQKVYYQDFGGTNLIGHYLPDMSIGQLSLTNGRIVSRLERIRTIVQMVGYEGYQDIDGMVIFKPPLYNLDVTYLDKPLGLSYVDTITQETNPFVVHLSEIESESEMEDQNGIRCTRINVQPSFTTTYRAEDGTGQYRSVISHTDIAKLAKFGLREQPANTMAWVDEGDKFSLYAYAVAELVRQNRSWRTYTMTIPMRPELRLGFPMYLPHKDMYGYIKAVSLSYTSGGAATMNVTLDSLRKRPMFPSPYKGDKWVLTTQPNLVMKWTTGSTEDMLPQPDKSDKGKNPADKTTAPVTLTKKEQELPSESQMEFIQYIKGTLGTSWSTQADTTVKCFRPQPDVLKPSEVSYKDDEGKEHNKGLKGLRFFSGENWSTGRGINNVYLHKIRTCQPYTDEKGYELISPFPWGRWKSLREAYAQTRMGVIRLEETDAEGKGTGEFNTTYANPQNAAVLRGVDTFLFAGVGSGDGSITPSTQLQGDLSRLIKEVKFLRDYTNENSSFELDETGTDMTLLGLKAPDAKLFDDKADVQKRIDMFLEGDRVESDQTIGELDAVLTERGNSIYGPLGKGDNRSGNIGLTPPSPENMSKPSILDRLWNKVKGGN